MNTVLAIDPGFSKCGIAVVNRNSDGALTVLYRGVVPTDDILETVNNLLASHSIQHFIMGNGTTAKSLLEKLKDLTLPHSPILVDEANTTLLARDKYWSVVPRRGWRKIVPLSLQVPPEHYDDFVAWILAERFLEKL